MEYCLSTLKQFLDEIRQFQKRASSERNFGSHASDSSDKDDSTNAARRWTPSVSVDQYVPRFVRQLLDALMALQENNIVHCDVKGDNIFISNENGRNIVKSGVSVDSNAIVSRIKTVCHSLGFQFILSIRIRTHLL